MRIFKLTLLTLFFTTTSLSGLKATESAKGFLPSPLLMLGPYFAHHVLVAEKTSHKLHLFQADPSGPKLVKSYQMATGKKAGNKQFQGDHRTPEGIYFIVDFIPNKQLLKKYGKEGEKYGVGAFVLNYPNQMDRRSKKTGGGIWVHSTNDETRIEKGLDSRGCVVIANKDLMDVSQYLELHKTPVIVVQDLNYFSNQTHAKAKDELKTTINNWLTSWQKEDIKGYLSHYSPDQFFDPIRGKFPAFAQYKKAVFSRAGAPTIDISQLTIFQTNTYAVAIFKQDYKSQHINDIGKKTLYLARDKNFEWKILSESWSKKSMGNEDNHLAFRPSMRFFKGPMAENSSKN